MKCKNDFYLALIKMNDHEPAIQKLIKITNESLIDKLENDPILFANRLGEYSDQAFSIIFLNGGLITTDLREEYQ